MSTEDFYIEASEETLQLNYCALASVVLVFYEHSLTLADEIRLIWASKMTGPKVLFVAARYILWAICLVQIWLIFPQSNRTSQLLSCARSMITDLSQYVVMLVFSALRAYAISGKHKAPAIIIAILLTFSVSINLYQYSTSVYAIVLNVGIKSMCDWGFMVSQNIGLILLTLVTVINMATWPSPGIVSAPSDAQAVSQDITYFQATRRIWHVNGGTGPRTFNYRLPWFQRLKLRNMGEYLHDDDTFHASEHDEELSTGVEQEVLEPEE
ncbi:predicted protein [Postia placenta Mad-698-R]|uniref:DUF6533 domain-containing protein n=1 Tax=Postia placenta MAD-698-R-SB12 TaxID=670580 RepID=A0A1X6N593_9APHY|nr:hypothetical protein POSPLADRAFT_1045979 [Postia placenta MAD-698-R-SB12]EED77570.1 predicted protein [Postia placenta Mad-698-R]OSX63774.1 hypothetical protein POSPLADRAFT_1045979 [Postia placenta MAD-698-R-SB12]